MENNQSNQKTEYNGSMQRGAAAGLQNDRLNKEQECNRNDSFNISQAYGKNDNKIDVDIELENEKNENEYSEDEKNLEDSQDIAQMQACRINRGAKNYGPSSTKWCK